MILQPSQREIVAISNNNKKKDLQQNYPIPRGDSLGLPSLQASFLRAADVFRVTWSEKLFTEMH